MNTIIKYIYVTFFSVLVLVTFSGAVLVSAQANDTENQESQQLGNDFSECTPASSVYAVPTWYEYLDGVAIGGKCSPTIDFLANPGNIGKVLLAVFEIILFISGFIAGFFVIYGGFQYLISQAEPDKIKGARTTIINALIGLVITGLSVVIVNIIGRNII